MLPKRAGVPISARCASISSFSAASMRRRFRRYQRPAQPLCDAVHGYAVSRTAEIARETRR